MVGPFDSSNIPIWYGIQLLQGHQLSHQVLTSWHFCLPQKLYIGHSYGQFSWLLLLNHQYHVTEKVNLHWSTHQGSHVMKAEACWIRVLSPPNSKAERAPGPPCSCSGPWCSIFVELHMEIHDFFWATIFIDAVDRQKSCTTWEGRNIDNEIFKISSGVGVCKSQLY